MRVRVRVKVRIRIRIRVRVRTAGVKVQTIFRGAHSRGRCSGLWMYAVPYGIDATPPRSHLARSDLWLDASVLRVGTQ